jgi:ABC-type transport system involved in cytochrome c biogenesis permease subunit
MKSRWLWIVGVILLSLIPLLRPVFFPTVYERVSQLPVMHGGRIKPLDTVARTTLLTFSGKQVFRVSGKKLPASRWLLDVVYRPTVADRYATFRIDDPGIQALLGVSPGKKRLFSYADLAPIVQTIAIQAESYEQVDAAQRTSHQRDTLRLYHLLVMYIQLKNTVHVDGFPKFFEHSLTAGPMARDSAHLFMMLQQFKAYEWMRDQSVFRVLGPLNGAKTSWRTLGDGLLASFGSGHLEPQVKDWLVLGDLYQRQELGRLGVHVSTMRVVSSSFRVQLEWLFNAWAPFYFAMLIYVMVFLGVMVVWLGRFRRQEWLLERLYWVGAGVFGIHTIGILIRMFLQGRPPVTNLYTSAVFVGWVAVLLGLILERLNRRGFGLVVASIVGFLTLIIAHHLAVQGDTLEMMQAVLDSNFWLSTHVVTVTMGYSATFLAGFLAQMAVLRDLFLRTDDEEHQQMARMIFGIVCFGLFFSFVGTVLGGIWADQSWGRFWGWDPKENGALMIVLWNAAVLHARLGGLIRYRGLLAMVIFGNIITAFSWFGVNMLGVGLHSYGFMDQAFFWLIVFCFVELVMMWLVFFPKFVLKRE